MLQQYYGDVGGVPAFVILDRYGNEVGRWRGYKDDSGTQAVINAFNVANFQLYFPWKSR